jgi:hypothetical protein
MRSIIFSTWCVLRRKKLKTWQLLVIVLSAGDGGKDDTGAARGTVAGGSSAAPLPTPPPALSSYPLDTLGRIRTRRDLAALINAGSDSITIKSEICVEGYEPMEEDESNDVICVVNLDERNRIISLDDPFGTDDNYVYEEGHEGTEGEELLEESEGSGEEGDDEGEDGADHPEGEDAGGPPHEGHVEPPHPVPDPVAGSDAVVDENTSTFARIVMENACGF